MITVMRPYGDGDFHVEADDYHVDEDGDLVLLACESDYVEDDCGDPVEVVVEVEVGRVVAGAWAGVFGDMNVEDDEEDCE